MVISHFLSPFRPKAPPQPPRVPSPRIITFVLMASTTYERDIDFSHHPLPPARTSWSVHPDSANAFRRSPLLPRRQHHWRNHSSRPTHHHHHPLPASHLLTSEWDRPRQHICTRHPGTLKQAFETCSLQSHPEG